MIEYVASCFYRKKRLPAYLTKGSDVVSIPMTKKNDCDETTTLFKTA